MKKSKSRSAFTSTSRRGDLAEAFRKAKRLLQTARRGRAKLGEVSVTIRVKSAKRVGKDDPTIHPPKDITAKLTSGFTGTSRRGDLAEAFRKAKRLLQTARRGRAKLGEVSVTIRVKSVKGVGKDDPTIHPPRSLGRR
ncbi:MAG: hypothetical protein DME50_04505 [Verrucomicrobia bacterium]|nr:MAG: hypothetical protein DME50_04505 [Verrucomicrobiota bacterium]